MAFNHDELSRLLPRLAEHPGIRRTIIKECGDAANTLLEALQRGVRLDGAVDEELRGVVLTAFEDKAQTVMTLSWDGLAPGGSGAVWVSEYAGIYVVTSSDYPPAGPFESLSDALSCECFFAATLEPQLHSDVLPDEELLEIARGVVDWRNAGTVWVNGVEYVVDDDDLRRQDGDGELG